jgi:hypothetical protein
MTSARTGVMMRSCFGGFVAAFVTLSALPALADDAPATPAPAQSSASEPAARRSSTTWYGYQTLAMDGVALALFIPDAASNYNSGMQGFGVGALVMYGAGAPLVHFSHGHVGKGFLDLGLRIIAPVIAGGVGGVIGSAAYQPSPRCQQAPPPGWQGLGTAVGCALEPEFATLLGVEIGGLVGMVTASGVDALVIAREPAARDDDPSTHANEPAVSSPIRRATLQPAFGVSPERTGGARATVGVVGAF